MCCINIDPQAFLEWAYPILEKERENRAKVRMKEYLLAFWDIRFRAESVTTDYLIGYAHALNDAGIINQDELNGLIKQLQNRELAVG